MRILKCRAENVLVVDEKLCKMQMCVIENVEGRRLDIVNDATIYAGDMGLGILCDTK